MERFNKIGEEDVGITEYIDSSNKGIKELEAKKAQLQELKKIQAEEDMFKLANDK